MSDYYDTLNVSRSATPEEIKKAYREQALKYHPDRNPDNPAAEETFKKVNEAYSVLSDPDMKSRYDMGGYTTESVRPGYGQGQENPYSQHTWTYYGPFGSAETWSTGSRNESYTRRDAVEMLFRSALTFAAGVLLFRFSFIFGIFGILLCITAIGRGLMNSVRAIKLLWNLKGKTGQE
jgi:DnaJ-class molecular chaperone with C-terminal Zn finger domain